MGVKFTAADLRVARGHERLTELEGLCDDVSDSYGGRLREHYPRVLPSVGALLELFDSKHPEVQIPPTVAILIGEVIYNFRAALDYLVCAVSKADTPVWTGRRERRNQFPIERTPEGFASRRETFLAGISDAHVRTIESYQPSAGCLWTLRLARLSNLDKHNDLVVVVQGIEFRIHESTGDGPHQAVFAPYVRLDGDDDADKSVTKVLEDLGSEVARVIDSFRASIQPQPPH